MSFSLFFTKLLIRSGIAKVLPGLDRWTEGSREVLHYLSDEMLDAPRRELREASELLEVVPPDGIDLAQSTPRFDRLAPQLARLAPEWQSAPLPWGLPVLSERAVERISAGSRMSFDPHQETLITEGATGAFRVVLSAVVNPGRKVVLFDPTSPLFPTLLSIGKARTEWVHSWVEEGRLRFHLSDLAKSLRRARLLILPPVGNPTGGVMATEDLEQIYWWARKYDVLVYNDLSFADYLDQEKRPAFDHITDARKRTFMAGSVSKSHGLAALRTGWLCADRRLLGACKLSSVLRTSFVPSVCQQIAAQALKGSQSEWKRAREALLARREQVCGRLRDLGLQPVVPMAGYFCWVPLRDMGMGGFTFAKKLMEQQRVKVTSGELCGPSGLSAIRLSFATEEGRLYEGLRRLGAFLGAKDESAVAA